MSSICILCQNNPPIENSHVVPRFVVKYLKEQSPVNYLKDSWEPNKKMQDGYKGGYLCKKCDNETVSNWENQFARKWFLPFTEKKADKLIIDDDIICFIISLVIRYTELWKENNPGRVDTHLIDDLQISTRNLLEKKQAALLGNNFFIYVACIQPIIDQTAFIPGINQLLFNSYHGIYLPTENSLPAVSLIRIPHFLFVFSETALPKPYTTLINKDAINCEEQNLDLLILFKSILNRHVSQMDINQRQNTPQLKNLAQKIQNDHALQKRFIYKAREWDLKLKEFKKNC